MKRVLELKQFHDETREQQKQTRSNILEVDPDAILPALSGIWLFFSFCSRMLYIRFNQPQTRRFGIQAETMN
jgi:hypothetical protein